MERLHCCVRSFGNLALVGLIVWRPENWDVVIKGFGKLMVGWLPTSGKDWLDAHGPPVPRSGSCPGINCVYHPYPARTTVSAFPKGRTDRPILGFQLLLSLNMRLRVGSPASEAVMMGRVAATAGTR